jgi:hypothetical protein
MLIFQITVTAATAEAAGITQTIHGQDLKFVQKIEE